MKDLEVHTTLTNTNARNLIRGRRSRLTFETCEQRALLSAVAVTTSADSGTGSFRAAVQQATDDPAVDSIVFASRIQTIQLVDMVRYEGSQDLRIDGNSVDIRPVPSKRGDLDLFVSTKGADLTLSELTFRDGRNGVVVEVPISAQGTVEVVLDRVTIADNGLFGLHIIDLTEVPPPPETPDADPTEIGSDAGVELRVTDSKITGNGTAAHDQDGIRIDERDDGGISVQILDSELNANGAEGIELDEAGNGGVDLHVRNSTFNDNGFIALEDETDPEFPDYDDGIDIDEADLGNVNAVIVNSTVSRNFDQGIDLNESGPGDLNLLMTNVRANHNLQEGVALEETDEGSMRAALFDIHANDNGSHGLKFEEFDAGNLSVEIVDSVVMKNGGYGIFASQTAPGSGSIRLRNVNLKRNVDGAYNTEIDNEATEDPDDVVDSGVVVTRLH